MSARTLSRHESVVLVVGGDARQGDRQVGDAIVKAIASSKFGGNGANRALIAAIRGGAVALVVVLARWLGHSEAHAIYAACRSVGIRYLIVRGGLSSAWNMVETEVRRSREH